MKSTKSNRKKLRDLDRSRKEILDVAFHEIFTRGFQGVSVDDIVKKTSLTKGAFYHHFPTKLDLGYALVDEVIKPMIIARWITPLASCDNILEGILTQMNTLIGNAAPAQLKLGCPLNNLVQEMAPIDGSFKKRLNAALELWIDETDTLLRKSKKAGFLRKEANTKQLAQFIVMAHEGIYGMLKGLEDPSIFTGLFKSLKTYFKTLQSGA